MWQMPLISVIVIAGFIGGLYMVFLQGIPAENKEVANVLLGTLAAMATQVVNYYLGSSKGSSDKTTLLAAAPAVPPVQVPPVDGK